MKLAKGCQTCVSSDKEVSQTCIGCMGLGRTKRKNGYKEAGPRVLKARGIKKEGSRFYSLDHNIRKSKKKVKLKDRPKLN